MPPVLLEFSNLGRPAGMRFSISVTGGDRGGSYLVIPGTSGYEPPSNRADLDTHDAACLHPDAHAGVEQGAMPDFDWHLADAGDLVEQAQGGPPA